MAPAQNFIEAPVLICAPTGADARNAADVLARVNIPSEICGNIDELCERISEKTGALMLTDETLDAETCKQLAEVFDRQPAWSDLQMLLLTTSGEVTHKVFNILNFFGGRANVTLVERPLRAMTLISVLKTALRSRAHQYEVRNVLESYSLAMEGAQLGSWDIDFHTGMTRHSARHDQIFGHKEPLAEWSLELLLQRIHEEDRGYVKAAMDAATKDGALQFECRIRWPDQSIHWISLRGRVTFDRQRQPSHMAGIVSDISSRREMEEAARIQRERLDLVLDGTEVGLWYWDLPEAEMSWNLRCKEHHNMSIKTKVTLENFLKTVKPENREATKRAMELSLEDGRPYDHEYRTVGNRWLRSIGRVFFNTAGNPLRFDGISMDVTARKHEEELLQETQDQLILALESLESRVKERTAQLQEALAEMEAFSYSVSHDLRAPLRAMQGYSQSLLNDFSDKLNEEGKHYLTRISNAAERLDRLTQDLLTYSRVVRSQVTLARVALGHLVSEVIHQYPSFQPEHADIIVQAPLLDVMGHEASLMQCISNLIGNGIKFVLPGVRPRITIWTESTDGFVRLYFQDNGIGIKPEQIQRIFKMFERLNKQYEGTGIGLTIVRKAAERMGGRVGVDSVFGGGSKFWIELPAAA